MGKTFFSESPESFFRSLLDPLHHESSPDILESDKIFNLLMKDDSAWNPRPPFEFSILPDQEDEVNRKQERKDAPMSSSLTDLFVTQSSIWKATTSNVNVLCPNPTCTSVESFNGGKVQKLVPVSDMELESSHVRETTMQFGNGGPEKLDTRDADTAMLDRQLASFSDFRDAQTHIPDVLQCDKEHSAAGSCKSDIDRNGLTTNQSMGRSKQATSNTYLNVNPSIRKCGRRFPCRYCNATFTRRGNCQRHMDIVHKKIKKFECSTCSMKFSTKQNMEAHQKKHFRNLSS